MGATALAPSPAAGVDAPVTPVPADQFRQAMRRLAGACTIITAAMPGQDTAGWAGLTATAVTSLTAEPARLLVCVNRAVWAHRVISVSGTLGINVLADGEADLAMRFAGGVDPAEKFATGEWSPAASGVPLLGSALVGFDCAVAEQVSASTHDIFLCDVRGVHLRAAEGDPLIYFNGAFLEARKNNETL